MTLKERVALAFESPTPDDPELNCYRFSLIRNISVYYRRNLVPYDYIPDLVNDVVVRCLAHAHMIRDEDKIENWIVAISVRVRNRMWRTRSKQPYEHLQKEEQFKLQRDDDEKTRTYLEWPTTYPGDNPFITTQRCEYLALLKRAMRLLSPLDRQIIHLFYYEGTSQEEIMVIMNLTPTQYRLRKSRALNRIRKSIHTKRIPLPLAS